MSDTSTKSASSSSSANPAQPEWTNAAAASVPPADTPTEAGPAFPASSVVVHGDGEVATVDAREADARALRRRIQRLADDL